MKLKIVVDESGRLIIPKTIRKSVGIKTKSTVFVEQIEDKIVITPAVKNCVICDSNKCVRVVNGKNICDSCIQKINQLK